MSTRWYPLYQRGNPQLRVFLPNFWMKLIKSMHKQPPNVVQFHCSMEMTKFDIRNYLEKIYNVKPIKVNTVITMGKFRKDPRGTIVKDDDSKIAYVVLPKDEKFVFPDLFKDAKDDVDENTMNETKKDLQQYIESNKAPGVPTWFRV
ncbi:hypothetical protein DMN91_007637 [Ooceraea biroi]|uniref:Large ribosomal subunit protein uL23m n=1 Tax=Ooceraea biroi TaxID=2015173 RepID=A0A026WFT1_OOCBI|nr:39S ribosomal protein L23, mitochondrial [Ooceraea biroi]EZA54793.1 39S ribosomal protein L23, mitochondrial [Ooceraea biroi]RLU21021.1 hypothetical protein DMN91_007637 [Ooceraea biroi]